MDLTRRKDVKLFVKVQIKFGKPVLVPFFLRCGWKPLGGIPYSTLKLNFYCYVLFFLYVILVGKIIGTCSG